MILKSSDGSNLSSDSESSFNKMKKDIKKKQKARRKSQTLKEKIPSNDNLVFDRSMHIY